MEDIYILLFVISYFVVGVVASAVCRVFFNIDDQSVLAIIVGWPFYIVYALFYYLWYGTVALLECIKRAVHDHPVKSKPENKSQPVDYSEKEAPTAVSSD